MDEGIRYLRISMRNAMWVQLLQSYAARQYTRWRSYLLYILLSGLAGAIISICFIFAPLRVKASIEDARLDNFSFTATQAGATLAPSLAYNVSLALTVDNRNTAYIKYKKPLVATLVFHDRRLYSATAMDEGLSQRPLKAKLRLLHPRGVVPPYMLDNSTIQDFKQQNATGLFKLEVRLTGEIARTIPWPGFMGKTHSLGLSCPLSLQLAPPGPEVVVFRKVSCKREEPDKMYF